MIVIDTSALMAILLNEPNGPDCEACLVSEPTLLISAATVTEALIVADRRGLGEAMDVLLETLAPTIVPLTPSLARMAARAYRRWGRGRHAAALNYGDTFAYALARDRNCPLLYVGDDFARTDVRGALV